MSKRKTCTSKHKPLQESTTDYIAEGAGVLNLLTLQFIKNHVLGITYISQLTQA